MFLSVNPPFHPLSANSIDRIKKKVFQTLGVTMSFFGPHSTRGAGVKFYKSLGMSSEVVCELGKWKNTEAFSKHYLRLSAVPKVGVALNKALATPFGPKTRKEIIWPKSAHKVPSCQSAKQGGLQSPRTEKELGRSNPLCEAQRQDGT